MYVMYFVHTMQFLYCMYINRTCIFKCVCNIFLYSQNTKFHGLHVMFCQSAILTKNVCNVCMCKYILFFSWGDEGREYCSATEELKFKLFSQRKKPVFSIFHELTVYYNPAKNVTRILEEIPCISR